MSPIDERLKSLNIVLPEVIPSVVDGYVPAFAPFIRSGDQIHLSGRLGKEGGKLLCGKVDDEISVDQGKLAARHVAIELLAVLKAASGDLGCVRRIVRLFVMVNGAPHFTERLSYLSRYWVREASIHAAPSVWHRCHSALASKLT